MTPGQFDRTPLRRTATGLWVPSRTLLEQQPDGFPEGRFVVTTVGFKEIFKADLGLPAIVERLSKYSLREVVMQLSRIALALFAKNSEGPFAVAQRHLLERLLSPDGTKGLIALLEKSRGETIDLQHVAFFHQRQLLSLAKLAFLVLPPDKADLGTDPLNLVEALLILNDVIDADTEAADTTTPEGHDVLELYMFASSLQNRGTPLLHRLARSYCLFVHPPDYLRAVPGYVDVPAMLERCTGMPAEEAWIVLFGLFAGWRGLTDADLDEGKVSVSKTGYFTSLVEVSAPQAASWFGLACVEAAQMSERIRTSYSLDEPSSFDVLVFEQNPLIAFGDEVYCVSTELMHELAGESLQHRCLDRITFSEEERRRFLDFRGILFQDYVETLLRRPFGDRLIPEEMLRGCRPEGKICDGIIDYGDAVVLYECKANLLPLAARSGANYELYRDKLTVMVNEAAAQMHATRLAIQAGSFGSIGLEASRIRRFFPLLLTWEIPMSGHTYLSFIEHGLREKRAAWDSEKANEHPMQVMEIDELETLEMVLAKGTSLAEQLQAKVQTEQYRRLAFNHFWHLEYPGAMGGGFNPYLEERYKEASGRTIEFFQARGLPQKAELR